ncbi:hypothetical protein [Mangrovicoccus ximenensis]|uniref:hypothetical protein n=1 Tax=Mangrovicoccus ximenensis TaxID=1911570 RepID=UPI0011AE2434|nr:hypothetical protein [Mangrovicoccus ximenensis]
MPHEERLEILNNELVYRVRVRTRQKAKAAPFEGIAISCNRCRRSGNGDRPPAQARSDMAAKMAAS